MTPVILGSFLAKEILLLSPLFRSDHREIADASAWIIARRRTGYRDTVTGGKTFLFFSRFLDRRRERGKGENTCRRCGWEYAGFAPRPVYLPFLCDFCANFCACVSGRARMSAPYVRTSQ